VSIEVVRWRADGHLRAVQPKGVAKSEGMTSKSANLSSIPYIGRQELIQQASKAGKPRKLRPKFSTHAPSERRDFCYSIHVSKRKIMAECESHLQTVLNSHSKRFFFPFSEPIQFLLSCFDDVESLPQLREFHQWSSPESR
jgi:hypothetical protein